MFACTAAALNGVPSENFTSLRKTKSMLNPSADTAYDFANEGAKTRPPGLSITWSSESYTCRNHAVSANALEDLCGSSDVYEKWIANVKLALRSGVGLLAADAVEALAPAKPTDAAMQARAMAALSDRNLEREP